MELKLGANIAALRRAKGMTQEQLAAALGISPPAVSKWETNTSYPNITLLCPLARALDTNVDMLLNYEKTLPDTGSACPCSRPMKLCSRLCPYRTRIMKPISDCARSFICPFNRPVRARSTKTIQTYARQ